MCNLKVEVPDSVSGYARRYLENARAMKYTQRLTMMKGAAVDQKLSAADARAVYAVKAALALSNDTEPENAWELGPWPEFDGPERFDGSVIAAASSRWALRSSCFSMPRGRRLRPSTSTGPSSMQSLTRCILGARRAGSLRCGGEPVD